MTDPKKELIKQTLLDASTHTGTYSDEVIEQITENLFKELSLDIMNEQSKNNSLVNLTTLYSTINKADATAEELNTLSLVRAKLDKLLAD